LQNRCIRDELWDWKTRKTLFGFLVVLMELYRCEVWGKNTSTRKWRHIERLQKHLITNNLKIKSTIPYEISMVEFEAFLIEASAMF